MSDMTHEDAVRFFSDLYGGEHHIPGHRYMGAGNVREWGSGWYVNHQGDMSTFDSNALTRLVFMAHDRAIRVGVECSGPGMIRIFIHKRQREGSLYQRHPSLESAITDWRKFQPMPKDPTHD